MNEKIEMISYVFGNLYPKYQSIMFYDKDEEIRVAFLEGFDLIDWCMIKRIQAIVDDRKI